MCHWYRMLRTRIHEYYDTYSDRVMQEKLLALLETKKWDIDRTAKQLGVSADTVWRAIRSSPALTRARIKARAEIELKKVT
jgi:transcriptional regulator of acetoin/glycerol metabolism